MLERIKISLVYLSVLGIISCGKSNDSSGNNQSSDLNSNAKQITVGYGYACGLISNGKSRCIGLNDFGNLGNGTKDLQSNWADISGNINFNLINAGMDHTCGIADSGTYCWGSNDHGQLGNSFGGSGSSNNDSNVPVLVTNSDLLKFKKISSGTLYTCALSNDNKIYCWGTGVGFGNKNNNNTPKQITGINEDFITVSASKTGSSSNPFMNWQTCGVSKTGSVYCWSSGTNGQPLKIQGISNAIDVEVANHSCALISDGSVYCWGANDYGQLGDAGSSGNFSNLPVQVQTVQKFKSIAVGLFISCGISLDNSAYCWGNNTGNESSLISNIPVKIDNIKFISISVTDSNYICGIDLNNNNYCWGKQLDDFSKFNNKPIIYNIK